MPNRTGDDDQPNRAEKGRLGHVDRPFAHIHPKGGTRGVDNQCTVRVCRVMCVCVYVCVRAMKRATRAWKVNNECSTCKPLRPDLPPPSLLNVQEYDAPWVEVHGRLDRVPDAQLLTGNVGHVACAGAPCQRMIPQIPVCTALART